MQTITVTDNERRQIREALLAYAKQWTDAAEDMKKHPSIYSEAWIDDTAKQATPFLRLADKFNK